MNISVYYRQNCIWSESVREVLDKYGLAYDKRDIVADRNMFDEMVRKSGQRHAPCVEIDGVMLSDVSGEDVENYLLSHEMVRDAVYDDNAVGNGNSVEMDHFAFSKITPPTQFF
jgi:glutaredoxin